MQQFTQTELKLLKNAVEGYRSKINETLNLSILHLVEFKEDIFDPSQTCIDINEYRIKFDNMVNNLLDKIKNLNKE